MIKNYINNFTMEGEMEEEMEEEAGGGETSPKDTSKHVCSWDALRR